jgi:hypothetical protein
MAANTGRKKRKVLANSVNGLRRKFAFMNSPRPTVCDNTPNGRDRIRTLVIPTNSAALS